MLPNAGGVQFTLRKHHVDHARMFQIDQALRGLKFIARHDAWQGIDAVSYTHLDVYKRQVFDDPVVQQRVEIVLAAAWLPVGFALGGNGTIWLHGDGAVAGGFVVPGVDGADGIADFL